MNDISRIEALERNLLSLERFVHDLQKDINDLKKRVEETGKSRHGLDELVAEAQEFKDGLLMKIAAHEVTDLIAELRHKSPREERAAVMLSYLLSYMPQGSEYDWRDDPPELSDSKPTYTSPFDRLMK